MPSSPNPDLPSNRAVIIETTALKACAEKIEREDHMVPLASRMATDWVVVDRGLDKSFFSAAKMLYNRFFY
jgi:hypothetical protein